MLFREMAQLYLKQPDNQRNKNVLSCFKQLIEQGLPFEIIDGDNVYLPMEFLEATFSQF